MLSQKLALITGAASGMGLETAKLFAKEGAAIIAVDCQESVKHVLKDLALKSSLKHSAYVCDVSSSQNVPELFEQIKNDYPEQKTPTIIVNCAGIFSFKPFIECTEDDFDRVIDVNLKGTFLINQAACKELVANYDAKKSSENESYATIVNISSVGAKMAAPCLASYCASKGGVEALTRVIAKEMAAYQIRCNAIEPGLIDTQMSRSLPILLDSYVNALPMKRAGLPKEIANICLVLASNMSSFMTGAVIPVDGGSLC